MRRVTSLPVVVLTATRNRPRLLKERFLPSLMSQERAPDHVVLVDDSDPRHRSGVSNVSSELRRAGRMVTCVGRTSRPGLAAAWNRGLRAAALRFGDAWIAGLDDDDWWLPNHLAECERTAEATGADVLFARSVPVRDGIELPRLDDGKPSLAAFLRGNPGFRGSTMFLRLSTILDVGGFDACMRSTLDRDLAVRLLVRGDARWAVSKATTVRYDVTEDRARLSSAGSRVKRQGLLRFLDKHRHLMAAEDLRAFWERAWRLFRVAKRPASSLSR